MRQHPHHVGNRLLEIARKLLGLIQNHHAIGNIVNLAAAAGFRRKQAFKQLHVGGNNQRRVPIFRGKAGFRSFLVFFHFQIAVVFQYHVIAQCFAENIGVLLDNTGERNSIDNTFFAEFQRVLQSEPQARQSFAAAGRHS